MVVLVGKDGKPLVNRKGQLIACQETPTACEYSTWRVGITIQSGAVDPENEYILCERATTFYVQTTGKNGEFSPLIGGSVEIVSQENCYIYDNFKGVSYPAYDSTNYAPREVSLPYTAGYNLSPDEEIVYDRPGSILLFRPFEIVYSYGRTTGHGIIPYNDIAPWEAKVSATLIFERPIPTARIKEFVIFARPAETAKFPNLRYTVVYEPITTEGE